MSATIAKKLSPENVETPTGEEDMNITTLSDAEIDRLIKAGGDVPRTIAARLLHKEPADVTEQERMVARHQLFVRLFGKLTQDDAKTLQVWK